MPSNEATGRIKIIKTPAGELPLKIREAWVGVILPCYPLLGYIYRGSEYGLLSGEKAHDKRRGVIVPQFKGMRVLDEERPELVGWLASRGFPQPDGNFFFGEDEVEIISGVTLAPARVFDDMETGHWRQVLP